MSRDLVNPVIGEAFCLHTDSVVGLLLHRITGKGVDPALSKIFLVVQRELTEFVNIIHRCRPSYIVGRKGRTVGRCPITSDAHRTVIEITVVVPLLSEAGRELQILKDLVSEIDIEIVP